MTLKELSKILHVSISTISKALNDSSEISEATKKRVKEAAEMYNYQPNKMALHLKSGKTNTIGVVIPSIKNNFFTEVLCGIESVLEKEKYSVIISITNESYTKEAETIATLTNGLIDGVILSIAEETQVASTFQHIEQATKPVVMFDRVIAKTKYPAVVGDDFKAVYGATKYLLAQERKEVVLVSTIHNLSVGKQRAKGFEQAIHEVLRGSKIQHITGTKETIDSCISNYLSRHNVDAFVALDEESSLAVLKALKEKSIAIPQTVSVIGYANETLAQHLTPSLTTINQHGFEMGVQAAQTMVRILSEKQKEVTKQTISSTIVRRGTT